VSSDAGLEGAAERNSIMPRSVVERLVLVPILAGAIGATALLATAQPAATETGTWNTQDVAAAERIAAWSTEVWDKASRGDGSEALALLERAPEGVAPEQAASLSAAIERYRGHLATRAEAGVARVEELRTEMRTHLDAGELEKSLASAIELDMLRPSEGVVENDATVRQAVDAARMKAAEMEAAGDWMGAYALYSRLHLLFEKAGTYKADELRLRDRLTMIRVYVPQRFHDMSSAFRVKQGEDPLPPYNSLGDDWKTQWAGVEGQMVIQALLRAATQHVDRKPVSDMLLAGYARVETLINTPELAEALPGLADVGKRRAFLDQLAGYKAAIMERGHQAGSSDIQLAVTKLLQANRETIGVEAVALLHEFGTGAAMALDDFTSFYWPEDLESFSRTAEGNFTGVGIQISFNETRELKVVTPIYGTPAAKAGIRPGDIIRTIDGESTIGIGLDQAVHRITGPAGTEVSITLERDGVDEPIAVSLRRAVIPLYSVKGWERAGAAEGDWDWFVDKESGIGYIRLTQFIKGSTKDMRDALRSMRDAGVNGVVLDLRFNGGGLLDEAVGVANLFIEEGPIVTQEDGAGREQARENARLGRAVMTDVPMVVLVNDTSASASEIVAGALQDYKRALIVGDRTYGKGSVQNVFLLGRGQAAFKLTTQYYKLPGGRLIHRKDGATEWGVKPDVEVASVPGEIGDMLELRQAADIVEFDAQGNPVGGDDRPDADRLITEGLDPQLETAVLLLQSRIVGQASAQRAAMRE
jgi:carboxyl-terminal processing protease